MRNLFFITLATLAVFFSRSPAPAGESDAAVPAAYVAVGRVSETAAVETKRYSGHVNTISSVNLVARVSGELLRVGFAEGDFVEAGQVLYELDPTRYEAEVINIEARIAEYEARLTHAEQRFHRAEDLFESRADTKVALESAESEFKASRASLMSAEAQLITVHDDLRNTVIRAPISGKIGLSEYSVGNYLTPNSGVMASIVQLDPLRISFAMSNKDYLSLFGSEEKLREQSTLRLRLADESNYEHEGVVEFLDNRANQRTDAIQVFAKFPNPAGKLVPGSTVTILLSRRNGASHAAVVPSAVMHDSKSAYVYVVDRDNRVERRNVVLGYATASLQAVKSGLEPDELVVIDGNHKTMPGAVIEPDFNAAATQVNLNADS